MLRGFRLSAAALVAFVSCLLWVHEAHAFERQWHLGGGAGVAFPPGGYSLGPALGAHAAYGISDVFDLRLELVGARHAKSGEPSANVFSGAFGIAYKLDVIEWVPYFGVLAGYQLVRPEPDPSGDLPGNSPSVGLIGGLDYGFSRSFGLGVCYRQDLLLSGGATSGLLLLRAEYRWGW
ncbi:MAG TPA: hypothetical protein VGP93_20950 [Polyangiaceae bacterium]|nr:hypothetical protein [Polyangiaceae bacterium]